MSDFELNIEVREGTGSASARRARRDGFLPGVLYKSGGEGIAVQMQYLKFTQKASRALPSQVFKLKSENSELNAGSAIVKDVQIDAQKDRVLHVDLQLLEEGQKVRVAIPVGVTGVPVGVKQQGGVLAVPCYEVVVECLPKDIPDTLTVDISGIVLGGRISTGEIDFPEGVSLYGNPEETVAGVVSGRQAALLAAEGKEGAEGEGEEGGAESSESAEEASSEDKGGE